MKPQHHSAPTTELISGSSDQASITSTSNNNNLRLESDITTAAQAAALPDAPPAPVVPRKRGRPRKYPLPVQTETLQTDQPATAPKLTAPLLLPPSSTSLRSSSLPSSSSSLPHSSLPTEVVPKLTGITDWRTLTKDEILRIVETIPEGLSVYDVLRAPRVPTGNITQLLSRKVRLSDTGLTEDLSCPICMSIYQNVAVVKDCLHRFCEECIERWLRTGHQDCPKCRNRIPSRRSLRGDPIFQKIVQRLFPDVESFERMNDKAVAAVNERKTGLAESVFYREDQGADSRPGRRSSHKSRRSSVLSSPSGLPPSTVKIDLIPDDDQPELKRLSEVKLSPLKILSLKQLRMMISVSGGLGRETALELRTTKDGPPLPMTDKVGDLAAAAALDNSASVTLYVRRAAAQQQPELEDTVTAAATASMPDLTVEDTEDANDDAATDAATSVVSEVPETEEEQEPEAKRGRIETAAVTGPAAATEGQIVSKVSRRGRPSRMG